MLIISHPGVDYHSTFETNQYLITFSDADTGISMWSTMTTPIGKCTPLEGVLTRPSTAKAIDLLRPTSGSVRR
jgi:hypothetical protein